MEKAVNLKGLKRAGPWLEIGIFLALLYGIHLFVFLTIDDFMYGSFARDGVFQNAWSYYLGNCYGMGNGRFWINILNSLLLYFDRYLYIILNPLLILSFILLLAKNVQWLMEGRSDRNREQNIMRGGMVLFACLNVLCLREAVFWISGMMSYLLPAAVFLLGLLMFQYVRAGRLKGRKTVLFWIVCLFAASSAEQFALMFVGMMTLLIGYDLIKKHKVPARAWIGYALSLAGLAFLLAAPGNFGRIGEHAQRLPNLLDNIWTLFYQNFFHEAAFPFILMLSLASASLFAARYKKRRLPRVLMFSVPALLLVARSIPALDKAAVVLALAVLVAAQMIWVVVIRAYPEKHLLLSLLIVGIGSQAMLLISVIWGFRAMLSLYLIYMILILCLIRRLGAKERLFILLSGITAALNPLITIAFWAVLAVLWLCGLRERVPAVSQIVIYISTAAALITLMLGYAGNAGTQLENLGSTQRQEGKTVVLKQLPDDTYSWYFLPFAEIHEQTYRVYHHIPDDIKIVYDTSGEKK